MKTINKLKTGDLIQVDGNEAFMLLECTEKKYVFIDPKDNFIFQKGLSGFDRKSCQQWITIAYREGIRYRFHPLVWGPLWK